MRCGTVRIDGERLNVTTAIVLTYRITTIPCWVLRREPLEEAEGRCQAKARSSRSAMGAIGSFGAYALGQRLKNLAQALRECQRTDDPGEGMMETKLTKLPL